MPSPLRSLSLAALLTWSLAGPLSGEDAELRGAWYPWDPYQTEVVHGPLREVGGLDVQLVTRILAEADRRVSFTRLDWDEQLRLLREGRLDLAMGAYVTPERLEYARFSEPYRTETDVLVLRAGEAALLPAESPQELMEAVAAQGLRLGVVEGFYYGPEMEAFLRRPEHAGRIYPARTDAVNLQRLLEGSIDAFAADRLTASTLAWRARVSHRLAQHPIPLYQAGIRVMFSKASTTPGVVEDFNEGLRRLKESGEYTRLLRHYAMPVLLAVTVQSPWFRLFDLLGTIAFAVSGVLIARREGYDIFGAFTLAALPAVGGGVLRDLVSGRSPLAIVASPVYLYAILGTVVAGTLLFKISDAFRAPRPPADAAPTLQTRLSANIYQLFDAIGLAAFTVIGVVVAVEQGCEPLWLWGALLAAITGAGGGILRDVVRADSNNPSLKGSLYPEVALLWGLLFSLFLTWEASRLDPGEVLAGVLLTIAGALATRLLILRFGWSSPLLGPRTR